MRPAVIAWIDEPDPNGRWGDPRHLTLPLADRGVQFADGLFETILVHQGRAVLLADHLARWRECAALLGMEPPPAADRVVPLLQEGWVRSKLSDSQPGALRLNWSRGAMSAGTARGLDLPTAADEQPRHRFWLQLTGWSPRFEPVSVIVSKLERRNAHSLLSRCKTFAYGGAIQARREARVAAADEALLLSSTNDLSCGTTANLLVCREGRWCTPSLISGCLPGVMRARGLASGLVEEARLQIEDLFLGGEALLINSLGCRPIQRCEGRRLERVLSAEAAQELWEQLQDGDPAIRR